MVKPNKKPNMTRVFIVGSGRCGTTLLQSRLSLHSQVSTSSEIGFFRLISPLAPRIPLNQTTNSVPDVLKYIKRQLIFWCFLPFQRLGYTNHSRLTRAYRHLGQIIKQDGLEELAGRELLSRISKHIGIFTDVMDKIALAEGKNIWLEQTPSLLEKVEFIEKHLPKPKFIQMVRSWTDVAASYYDAAQKYQETAWACYNDLDRIVNDLNQCIKKTKQYAGKSNYLIVQYEDFVKEPKAILETVCEFIGIPFEEQMLHIPKLGDSNVVQSHEIHKFGIFNPIDVPKDKFHSIFSEQQRQYILQRLITI